jgi:hypothetical protein
MVLAEVRAAVIVGLYLLCRRPACEQIHHPNQNEHNFLHFHNSSFFEISIEHRSSTRYANQHFLTAIQGDLLMSVESRCS